MRARLSKGLALLVTAALCATLAACDADRAATKPTHSATKSSARAGGEVVVHTLDPQSIPGVTTVTQVDQASRIHVTIPEVPGATSLNEALASDTQAAVTEYLGSTTPGGVAPPELNITWQALGVSPEVIGIRTLTYLFAGASAGESARSYWYDVQGARVRPNVDLVTSSAALNAAIEKALSSRDIDQQALADVLAHGGPPVLGFTDKGRLVASFDEYQISAGSEGLISVALPDSLLSDFGRAAQSSSRGEPVASQSPSPSATPATSAPASAPVTPQVNCRKLRCVALTYDDGPGNYTNRLLDILRRKQAVATYFVLGQQVDTYPDVAKRIVSDGNEIASHTWSHRDLTRLSPADVRSEMQRTARIITATTGTKPTLVRPPYGATNDVVRRVAKQLGEQVTLWSVDTLDWRDRNAAVVERRVLNDTRRGSIVLMHDIHSTTVDAAARIIDQLRARGFTLVTVSQLHAQ